MKHNMSLGCPNTSLRQMHDLHVCQWPRGIALAHHENWDGSGYPGGVKGEAIPLSGRIVKIADIYDALRSKRSYKPALNHEQVLGIFHSGDNRVHPGEHFDPALLRAFFQIEHKMAGICADIG